MWEKIVLNLLSNALKFTFDGSDSAVALRATPTRCELRVRDTGVGIPDRARCHTLFERFHRVQGTRARTHEGTGIGLALVQRAGQACMAARSRVDSEVDRGTTFTVIIPTGMAHLAGERVHQRVGTRARVP